MQWTKDTLAFPLLTGFIPFCAVFLLTSAIDSPLPFWASLSVGFLFFEIGYYFFFKKRKDGMWMDGLNKRRYF